MEFIHAKLNAITLIHLLFTFFILSSWMYHSHCDIKHANPGWFIPVVGNLFVPIGGVHFVSAEVGWFFFSIGILFWIVLMTIIFYRVIFHDPIPPACCRRWWSSCWWERP